MADNGNFDAHALQNVTIKMAQLMSSNNNWIRKYKNPKHKTLKALMENQGNAATVLPLENPAKDPKVSVLWYDKNSVSAGNLTTNCDFTGEAGSGETQEYNMTDGKEAIFSYDTEQWRTSQYDSPEEYLAAMIIMHSYAIVEGMNASALAFLDANLSGANGYTAGYTFDAGTDTTAIPAAEYSPALWTYLSTCKEINDMDAAFLIGGVGVREIAHFAEAETDATGRNLIGDTPIYVDTKGLASASNDPFYLVDPSSFAFAKKTRYTSTPVEDKLNRVKYAIADPFGLGLMFDVIEKHECLSDDAVKVTVKLKIRYDFFANPKTLASPDDQGILKFVKA